jgi:hypothetical protein
MLVGVGIGTDVVTVTGTITDDSVEGASKPKFDFDCASVTAYTWLPYTLKLLAVVCERAPSSDFSPFPRMGSDGYSVSSVFPLDKAAESSLVGIGFP